ncbi:hypothetical protein [Phyllobacterium chamaecytisi]|uniref:hypothetical protein n=1 Tax=Phyllobacterium chamaecytisi TaxID=2876082 RepID=UPI001CCD68D2|nr:hypothetical protein [Phyllobacterium sp. KW56]MBZ9600742.1 hypothetical protein [Phyllobacterium sp. KW56]
MIIDPIAAPLARVIGRSVGSDSVALPDLVADFTITIGAEAAAPTYLGAGAVGATTSVTTITPALAAGMAANDIIVLQAVCLGSNTAFDLPTGYTLISDFNVGSHRVAWWWKRHTGTESAVAVVNTGRTSTNLLAAQSSARRGCITTGTPYEALNTALQAAASVVSGVAVTSSGWRRLAEQNIQRLGANTASTPSLPWLENLDQGTSGGGGCRFYIATSTLDFAETVPATDIAGANVIYGAIGLAWKGVAPEITVSPAKTQRRGLWVWDYSTVIATTNEKNILLNECVNSSITDLYCFTTAALVTANAAAMRSFNAQANALGIRVWGLDGDRGHFSDGDGFGFMFANIDAVIAFNAASTTAQKFCGFQIDNEPPDTGIYTTFHNGIASSVLSAVSGGVWQATQALDREFLMRDWVSMHSQCKQRCATAGLLFGSALPTWVDDYFGEPITCTYDHGDGAGAIAQNVFLHIARYTDVIASMSYVTTASNLIDRVRYETGKSNQMVPPTQIGMSIESAVGVGSGTSYGDTAGKQTKAAALADLTTAVAMYSGDPAVNWTNLHDWAGWKALSPASVNTATPTPTSAPSAETVYPIQSKRTARGTISLSASTVSEAAAVDIAVGTLSGGSGHVLRYDPGRFFKIVSGELRVARRPIKPGSYAIQVSARAS